MATASSWMPAAGRHNVSIGSSLSKALKARKGQPPTQRSKVLPERDFYALRYNHKPASIDATKPGTLEVNQGKEVTTVRVERPTVNNNEVIVFKGDEKPAKEWECVLIYDEATQTFTLEKLDSLVNLNFDAKAPPRTRQAASPASLSSSSAAQTPQRSQLRTAADELEAQLEGSSTGTGPGIDAKGKPDPGSFSSQVREEEEEEEGAVNGGAVVTASPSPMPRNARSSSGNQKAHPPPSLPPPSQQPAQQPKARPTKKSAPTSTTATPQFAKAARVSATPAASAAPAASSSKQQRSRPGTQSSSTTTSTTPTAAKRGGVLDVEDFEIRGPIAPVATSATASASTTRRSSTAAATPVQSQASFSLALPSAYAGPDPLAHQGLYGSGSNNGAATGGSGGASASASVSGAMDSDDEWDEVLTQPDRPTSAHHHQQQRQQQEALMMIEDEADDGLDFLERELLGEDEPMGDADADADADGDEEDEDLEEIVGHGSSSSSRAGAGASGPISMNQFAGGDAAVDDDDDDFSSSEESEED